MDPIASYDVFDTLIARTVPHPHDIFSLVEKIYPYPRFKALRIEAERRSNGTIADIYKQFQSLTGESNVDALRELELKLELEHTIPIQTNINKLKSRDILISDMYLTEENIATLLRKHGVTKYASLFVSAGGKHHGFAWEKLSKEHTITHHTGDNMHSDVLMPARYGIRGVYTNAHKFTSLETTLFQTDPALSRFLRTFRLSNPYGEITDEYKLFQDQITMNIPLLLFMCRAIATKMETTRKTTLLCLSRDGCLLIKLFRVLYPQFNAIYFHSSRLININYNDDYVAYLKRVYNKDSCLLFDLNGSYKSARPLFLETFGELPDVLLFQYNNTATLYPGLSYMIKSCGDPIESLNIDLSGTLCNFVKNIDIRTPLEYKKAHIVVNHNTIDIFCAYILQQSASKLLTMATCFSDVSFWSNYYKTMCSENQFFIKNKPSTCTLTELANMHKSEKGSNYKNAHCYTLQYEQIVDELVNKQGVDIVELLDIGLNVDGLATIPNLRMWNDYFNSYVNITCFDMESAFTQFNGRYPNIRIHIGDLHPLLSKKYHLIIDNGCLAPKDQQIRFKQLWNCVAPGGYYVIENIYNDEHILTRNLFEKWLDGLDSVSDYISLAEASSIRTTIKTIVFSDSKSTIQADVKQRFVSIRKSYTP
jgi:hypothetical protein